MRIFEPDDKPLHGTRVLLLRHAETADPSRFHGSESDIGLGAVGHRQAATLAEVLPASRPAAVISSAMRRARETAQPIAVACHLPLQIEPDLHERSMGPLSGQNREEGLDTYRATVARWVAGDLDATHPDGESFAQIQARTVPILRRLATTWTGATIVVIAHGVVIRVLLTTLLPDRSPADFAAIAIDNAAVNDLRCDPAGVWSAAELNVRLAEAAGDGFVW